MTFIFVFVELIFNCMKPPFSIKNGSGYLFELSVPVYRALAHVMKL